MVQLFVSVENEKSVGSSGIGLVVVVLGKKRS
jgi:hypothetical protein